MRQDIPSRRESIISAALDLFALRGYEATSIADIASYAESTPEAVTSYFRGKHQILREVLTPTLQRIDTILDQHEAPDIATEPTRTAELVADLINCIADAGPQVVALLEDPAVGEQVYAHAHDGAVTERIERALTAQLSRIDPGTVVPMSVVRTAARMRAACAVAAIPTAIAAWAEINPATPVIDQDVRDTIIDIVQAIITGPYSTAP